MPHGVAL